MSTVSFFFFSSRRRHTRCSRDWSSDVCSSDLVPLARAPVGQGLRVDVLRQCDMVGRHDRPRHRRTEQIGARVHGTGAERGKHEVANEFFAQVLDDARSEEHTSELQSRLHLVCRLLLEKKKKKNITNT